MSKGRWERTYADYPKVVAAVIRHSQRQPIAQSELVEAMRLEEGWSQPRCYP